MPKWIVVTRDAASELCFFDRSPWLVQGDFQSPKKTS